MDLKGLGADVHEFHNLPMDTVREAAKQAAQALEVLPRVRQELELLRQHIQEVQEEVVGGLQTSVQDLSNPKVQRVLELLGHLDQNGHGEVDIRKELEDIVSDLSNPKVQEVLQRLEQLNVSEEGQDAKTQLKNTVQQLSDSENDAARELWNQIIGKKKIFAKVDDSTFNILGCIKNGKNPKVELKLDLTPGMVTVTP